VLINSAKDKYLNTSWLARTLIAESLLNKADSISPNTRVHQVNSLYRAFKARRSRSRIKVLTPGKIWYD
jgi:hypothetical protein